MPEGTALLQKSLIKRKKWTTRQNVVVSSHQLTIRGFFFCELLSHMKNNMTAIKLFWSMEVNFLLVWEPAIFFFFLIISFVLFYLELLSTVHVKV